MDTSMDAAAAAAALAASNTSTFEPPSDLIQEDDCNTLLLYLPGFTKEQLRVQLTRARVLKISGRRPLGNNRWISFQNDFPILENCDTSKITAKFEEGILYVRQPKEDKKLTATATAAAAVTEIPHPAAERPPPAKSDPPPRPPTPIKHADAKKPGESREESRSGEKSSEREGGKSKRAAEMRDKGAGRVEEAGYKRLNAATRKKVANILVLACVFALGVYVSRLSWFSKSLHD